MTEHPEFDKSWRNAQYISALCDTERHLGHVVMTEAWHAYDATKPNEASIGMKYLGEFSDRREAQSAVEASVAALISKPKVMRAGSRF